MSANVPTAEGLYLDRDDMVWAIEGNRMRCVQAPGEGYDLREAEDVEDLDRFGPYARLVAFTAEERAAVNDLAGQIATALHLSAVGRERWGSPRQQADLTRDLIAVDLWRAITEKTRAS